MERSHFLAKLIGPVFIASGLGMLFNATVCRVILERAPHDHVLIYLTGAIALPVALATVAMHNDWKWRWPLIVTLIRLSRSAPTVPRAAQAAATEE